VLAANTAIGDFELLLAARRRHVVPVRQPMAMITQAPRSGGTLLLRLFDGHPQCHTMPHEFGLGLSHHSLTTDLEQSWQRLWDEKLPSVYYKGLRQSHAELHGDRTRYPILMPPEFHRAFFDERLAAAKNLTDRDVVDAYLTAFFNAWLNNQNLYGSEKRWIVGFTPRLIGRPNKVALFRRLYPDGRIISVIRDPVSWFASARRWSRRGSGASRQRRSLSGLSRRTACSRRTSRVRRR
jgi:hypothetical protein